MASDLVWRTVPDAADIIGLSSSELHCMASLWKRTCRELTVSFGGNSMLPTIAAGDKLRMLCTEQVVPGDVVAFIYLDQVVVHRLVARTHTCWLTRGDAQTIPDRPLTDATAIIGKITGVVTAEGDRPLRAAPVTVGGTVALMPVRIAALLTASLARVAVDLMREAAHLKARLPGGARW